MEILNEVQADIDRLDERQTKNLNAIEESCREMVQDVRTVDISHLEPVKVGV